WEITPHGLFAGPTVMQFKRAPEFEVARGERVTVRAVLRDARAGDPERELPNVVPGPGVLQALRELVAAKEGIRDTATIREAAGKYSKVEVVEAEIDLSEARIQLAVAEGNAAERRALLEQLVTQRQGHRRPAEAKVGAGHRRAQGPRQGRC